MRRYRTFRSFLFVLAGGFGIDFLSAQDRFPAPIPEANFSVQVKNVAAVPDSSPGQPPRISVLTEDPSSRIFANDQRGPLYLIDESAATATEYLDLRDFPELDILFTFEAGFQSFAFHPDFFNEATQGYGRLYTIHSSGNTGATPDFDPGGNTSFHTLLLEWQTNNPESPTFIAADSQTPYREILRFDQPFGNHNAGLIAFNPTVSSQDSDYGNLYIAIADGGNGGDPQENGEDPSNPYGAILRINPLGTNGGNRKYGIVSENVLAADNNPATIPEIYCYGLRNPQRFGWDPATGNCYIADIGQNAVEEINLAANGAHFGWDIREGSFAFEGSSTEGLTNPIAEYDHTSPVANTPIGGRAVTSGEVVRNIGVAALEGHLPIADFPTGLFFILDVDNDALDGGQDGLRELLLLNENDEPVRFLELINTARTQRGLSPASRADLRFSVNTPGRLYLINKQDGIIRRILAEITPTVAITAITAEQFEIEFVGQLESSSDLQSWQTEDSSTEPKTIGLPLSGARFLRTGSLP